MNCSRCGSAVPENGNSRFCQECGAPLMPQVQIPLTNAGGAAPQARSARGYGGAPARNASPSPQSGGGEDATMFGTPAGVQPPAGQPPRRGPADPGPAQGDATMYGSSSGGYTPQGPGRAPQGDATMFGTPSGGFTPQGPGRAPQGAPQGDSTMYGSPSGGFNPRGPGRAPQSAPQGDSTMYGSPSGGYSPQGPGRSPQQFAQGDATAYGANPPGGGFAPGGAGYPPPGAGFTPRSGGPDDTVFLGANGEGTQPEDNGGGQTSGGDNKKFLAIVIPLITVIIASLVIIFIFVVYPAITDKSEDETTTESTTAAQETEKETEAAETEKASAENVTEAAAANETEAVTTVIPVSSSGYETGHYVNSTESRVHIRGSTSKSGKHLDYVVQDEYIDVFEVLDLGSSTDSTVRWWGKVSKNGKTGWVSLYYLTCVDLKGTSLNSGQINQLWQSLLGYWNTLDKKRYTSFTMDNGSPYFVYSPWSGSAVISAHADAEGMGDLSGLVRLHLHEAAGGSAKEVNAELYLDLSEMKNGRIAWSFGNGWEDGYFAGTDQSKAKPKS